MSSRGGVNVVVEVGNEVMVGVGVFPVGNGEEGVGVGEGDGFEEGLGRFSTKTTIETASMITSNKETRTKIL